ncbi:MAG: phage tail protein [Algibacter sp.]|uniref:phage tail protein n=1 Tax=Algibacter sp. TaxID=1872428 RepID=UPI003297AB44
MNDNPVVNFHFSVSFDDVIGGFSEITGLKAKHEILEYRSGDAPNYSTIKVPGLRKYSNIVLKRGTLISDNSSFSWFDNIGLIVEKRDFTIQLLNHQHEPTIVWQVRNAWPIQIDFSELNAKKSEILIETLELAHEGFTIQRLGN